MALNKNFPFFRKKAQKKAQKETEQKGKSVVLQNQPNIYMARKTISDNEIRS